MGDHGPTLLFASNFPPKGQVPFYLLFQFFVSAGGGWCNYVWPIAGGERVSKGTKMKSKRIIAYSEDSRLAYLYLSNGKQRVWIDNI